MHTGTEMDKTVRSTFSMNNDEKKYFRQDKIAATTMEFVSHYLIIKVRLHLFALVTYSHNYLKLI